MDDLDTIREALRRYNRLALSYRYGGLGCDYRLAQQALDALERVRQPTLWPTPPPGDA